MSSGVGDEESSSHRSINTSSSSPHLLHPAPAVGHDPEHWSVYRRYLEFYVLESKLTEFHGEALSVPSGVPDDPVSVSHWWLSSSGTFADAQLPSKRIIGPKNYEFLVSKRKEFEEYLQVR